MHKGDLLDYYKSGMLLIVNNKNYGHITSPFYGLLQSSGDATILMASDFQDPIELIPQLIKKIKK